MIQRHRASAICVYEGKLLTCRFCDPSSKKVMLVVPGGGIDEGEEPIETARREVLEETGYSVKVDKADSFVSQYLFEWNGKVYDCTTHWFRAFLDPVDQIPQLVDDADFNWGPGWLPLDGLDAAFSYNAHILESVKRLS